MRKLIYLFLGIALSILLLMLVTYPSMKISAQEAQTGPSETVTLTWDANTESNMSHYIVYWGTVSRQYEWNSGDIGLVTIHSQEIIPPADALTRYYFAVTAVNTYDLESDFSNEVYKDFDTRLPPAPPTGLKWYKKVISWIIDHLFFWA